MRTNRLILFLGATLLLAACGKEAPSPDAGSLPDHCIELRLANLHPALETKADAHSRGADAYNENLVLSVDCFFYPNGKTNEKAVFTAFGRGAEPKAEGDSTIYTVKVFFTDADAQKMFGSTVSGTCEVYVICNAPLNYGSNTSAPALKELVVEHDFSAQTVQESFVMPAEEPSTVTLTTTGSGESAVRTASGRVHVKRSAAKMQLYLHIPTIFVDEGNQEWEPVFTQGVQIMMANLAKRGKVDGSYSVQTSEYVSTEYRPVVELDPGELLPGKEFYNYSHVPFYSYPCAWSDLSDYASTFVFRIPWRIKGETGYQWKSYQLSPNLVGQKFEANHFYRTYVTISSLGGADIEHAVVIPECDYVIQDWINESAGAGQGIVPGELVTYKYLVVDEPDVTLNNEETAQYTYVTSAPLSSIKITKVQYYDNMQAEPLITVNNPAGGTITATTGSVSTAAGSISVSRETTGLVTMSHSLSNQYSQIVVYATITNSDGCTQDIIMTQNPSIQLIRKGGAGNVFVNGYFGRVQNAMYAVSYYPYTSYANYMRYYDGRYYYYTITSSGSFNYYGTNQPSGLSGGTWANAGTLTNGSTFQYYFYLDNSESNHFYHSSALWEESGQGVGDNYNSTTQSGTYGTILGAIYSLDESIDRNFYTTLVSVSSFNDANNYYTANGSNIEYRIGDPRVKASTVYTGANSWDTVTNFYKYLYYSGSTEKYESWQNPGDILIASQAVEDRNIIAPRILVSSGLNANSGLTFDTAVKRGATYQEAGYPAGRWRLPSEAEIAFIVARQRDGVIPALYATNSYYWSGSGRLVYIPTESSAAIQFYTPAEATAAGSTKTTYSCRFVYDLWYWGEEAAATNVYHPNGHVIDY